MFIAKKGKIIISFEETLKKIEECENFEIAPLDADILRVADKIEVYMEMHDKLIVATALYFDTGLITKDELIRKSGIVAVLVVERKIVVLTEEAIAVFQRG